MYASKLTIQRTRRGAAAAALLAALGVAAVAPARAQIFNFENQAATFDPNGNRPGALTSLVLSSGGVQVTIRRSGGQRFDLVSNTGPQADKPAAYGNISLDPFFNQNTNDFFIADFSVPVESVRLDFGDYDGVPTSILDNDTLTLTAFSSTGGTGTQLAQSLGAINNISGPGIFSTQTLSLAAPGIRSVTFVGGSANFPNSVFYDNLIVTSAPEPGSVALLGVGLAGAVVAVRRRRKA